ncbi:MAG: DNA sulfur modification protein DndD [Pasteurella sp.]|nr:DNA sulfur modification protein DndD [Pasteurella sp.]
MKFANINICNFRQYYGNNSLDLTTTTDNNIILVGGRNGYGKTNLLLAVVWCLYGEKISQVDDNFRKEIRKEKNYSAFIQHSLNWTAESENTNTFSVCLQLTDMEIPSIANQQNITDVVIARTFDIRTAQETLTITPTHSQIELFTDEDEKVDFINNYVIPLDAAKFVFFDAEKIAEIANFSIREEGSFINDAFNKILGLDIYEQLINDLSTYVNSLKKLSVSGNIQEQIIDIETTIDKSTLAIEQHNVENAELENNIQKFRKEIDDIHRIIEKHSPEGLSQIDIEAIKRQRTELNESIKVLETNLHDLGDMIPLAILVGKLNEVKQHLELQKQEELSQETTQENAIKIEQFIEALFNKPPEPESPLPFKDKMFYYEKAKDLSEEFFSSTAETFDLPFQHDLSNSEKQMIYDAISAVDSQQATVLENAFSDFNRALLKQQELERIINQVDAEEIDEYLAELINNKKYIEQNIIDATKQIGHNEEKTNQLKQIIEKSKKNHGKLLEKVAVSDEVNQKLDTANRYIKVLSEFIKEQKDMKKGNLERNILSELKKLMHKLSTNNQFINDVEVTILPDGNGMKVSLFDGKDNEIKKETLSQGEKQLYISCLIKAILKESIHHLPIFIDTPLGRLDNEHINNILQYYYPNLSNQVILLSTNNEITPRRLSNLSDSVSQSYLIKNDGKNSTFVSGYFQGER